eukprot:scaffold19769_cov63-Phaeocystis_antarctica.AAC.9
MAHWRRLVASSYTIASSPSTVNVRLRFERSSAGTALRPFSCSCSSGSTDFRSSKVTSWPSTTLTHASVSGSGSSSRWCSARPAKRPSSAKYERWSGPCVVAECGLGWIVRPPSLLTKRPYCWSSSSDVAAPSHSRRSPSPSALSPSNCTCRPRACASTCPVASCTPSS